MSERANILITENLKWADNTNIHPISIVIVIIAGIAILRVPHYRLIWPFAIVNCFVSPMQKIAIFSLDFDLTRIMLLFGLVRFLIKPSQPFVWHRLDKLIIYFSIIKTITYTLQLASLSAFINKLGFSFDIIGLYFIFRKSFLSWEDIEKNMQVFVLLSIPVSLFFIFEHATGHNLFSIFGGVPEITVEREGRLRCQGAFPHPIVAGCFWAVLLPLIVSLKWKNAKAKLILPVTSMLIIIVATSSSTPATAVFLAIVGGLMFSLRRRMKLVRRAIVFIVIGLHLVMKAPVWHLIARVSIVPGSTSYYRFALLDGFIRHANEWILLGTPSTNHWCWGCFDLTNQYVFEGVTGGLLSLLLFIAIITVAFSTVGKIWRRVEQDKAKLVIAWACGVAIFVHCANFIGISYFGQITMLWYLQLAMIASIDIFTKQALAQNRDALSKSQHLM